MDKVFEISKKIKSEETPAAVKEAEGVKEVIEKFFRGAEAKERVVRGLGLGLYYVKQIVEAHGGSISVESKPGEGTAFHIKIPRDDRSATC